MLGVIDSITPDAGHRCFTAIRGGVVRSWISSDAVTAMASQGWDTYFAPSGFRNSASRAQENVEAVRAFWLDIDAGDSKPYADEQAAVAAVRAFCQAGAVPQPDLFVGSGWGVHVYWVLDHDITSAEWTHAAQGLKALCVQHGLSADPARTADCASIMRIPGTTNWKQGPRPVTILEDRGTETSWAHLKTIFKLSTLSPVAAARGKDPLVKVLLGDFPDTDALVVASACKQIASMRDTGGVGPEPWWRACLSVVYRCVDGAHLIHEWSQGDPRYNHMETARKAANTQGPATCDHFKTIAPDGCNGCTRTVTSPIVTGTARVLSLAPAASEVPTFCTAKWRLDADGVFKKAGDEWEPVVLKPLWVEAVMERHRRTYEADRSTLVLNWVGYDGVIRAAPVAQDVVHDAKRFTSWLADHNLISLTFKTSVVIMYIADMTRARIQMRQVQAYYDRLGWVEQGFVLGNRLITANTVEVAQISEDSLLGRMTAQGEASEWSRLTQELGDPAYRAQAYVVIAALGSILLPLVGRDGSILSISGATSHGKTLSASLGLSIYGPSAALTQDADATANAVVQKLGVHGCVPHLLDESTKLRAGALGAYLYTVANGRGKDVLTQTRRSVPAVNWRLTAFVTTNEPILDNPMHIIQDAQRRRVLELSIPVALKDHIARSMMEAITEHYGVVAVPYIQAVLQSKGRMLELWEQAEQSLAQWGACEPADRFRTWQKTSALVGGRLAHAIGLIRWDPNLVVRHVHITAGEVFDSNVERFLQWLREFTTRDREYICIWGAHDRAPPPLMYRGALARYDRSNKALIVMDSHLKEACLKQKIPFKAIREWALSEGAEIGYKRLAPNGASVYAMTFQTKKFNIQMEDE